jgi:hypothetical protein
LEFAAFHPQGLARVGDRLLLSSAELLGDTPYPTAQAGYSGHGRGHVFELDMTGGLLRETIVGEGDIFHPGGICYDGRHVWVPVAEYRPDSRAIVYRLDPDTMTTEEAFRFDDHIGAVAHDRLTGLLHAATWGSARLIVLDPISGKVLRNSLNNSRYVDYQDCATVGHGKLVCTGVTEYPLPSGETFSLGGIGVVDVATGFMQHETPVTTLSPAGRTLTFNAVHLEVLADPAILRMYAVPDDSPTPAGGSTLLVAEAPLD